MIFWLRIIFKLAQCGSKNHKLCNPVINSRVAENVHRARMEQDDS